MKKFLKISLIILIILAVLAGIIAAYYFAFMNPRRGTITEFPNSEYLDTVLKKEEAMEDLEYLYNHLKSRHPAWLDGSDDLVSAVDAQYEKETANLGNEVSVMELYKAAGRIAAKLGDGHTYVVYRSPDEYLYIDDFNQLKDYDEPIYINGESVEEYFQVYKQRASYELEFYARDRFTNNLALKDFLYLLGVDTSQKVTMTYNTPEGEKDFEYDFVSLEEVEGFDPETMTDGDEWVYYEIDKENSVGIFTLKSCDCNDEYLSTLDNFFQEVFEQNIENVVVDLRGNGGGNSWVANEFLKYIETDGYNSWRSAVRYGWYLNQHNKTYMKNDKKSQTFSGDIYVLTNHLTFSAAMDFAMFLGDNDLGVLVGSTSGNMPQSYGDCLYFSMPNSKILMSISYKKWWRVDQSKWDEPLTPDYEVAPKEAMDEVYRLINNS